MAPRRAISRYRARRASGSNIPTSGCSVACRQNFILNDGNCRAIQKNLRTRYVLK
jgi:hypothetical protein